MHTFDLTSVLATLTLSTARATVQPSADKTYIDQELAFLAPLHDRLTGSPKHNLLIDRIHSQLEALNLVVRTDSLEFSYYDGPRQEPKLAVQSEENGTMDVPVTSYAKYSGFTSSAGVTGPLIDVCTSSVDEMPDWSKAAGGIALTNITNTAANYSEILRVWPGSPEWNILNNSPESSAEAMVANLTVAAQVGVKGVVYAWEEASTGLVQGQWVPFHELYQGVPTLFVQGLNGSLDQLVDAAANHAQASLTLEAHVRPETKARTVYTIIPGTEMKNESFIINTHTDGTNIIEENGYIALLAYAAHLARHPPCRTTILVFVGQHMHYEAFAQDPYKATSRWLNTHPELWAGEGNRYDLELGGQLKAVAGSCAEHLGALHWSEDIEKNTYAATDGLEPELLYASTSELDDLLREQWQGAEVNVTRVTDPVDSLIPQAGEGYPFYLEAIPNFSLVTNPNYLLKIWPEHFDERALVDVDAVKRQVDSFVRIWSMMDEMDAADFGTQSKKGRNRELHV